MADPSERIVMVDLDGTLAEYHGWSGEFTPIGEPIIDTNGWTAKAFCESIQRAGYQVIIWTVRDDPEQIMAWLAKHRIPYDGINIRPANIAGCSEKPAAAAYVDDRAIRFRGSYAETIRELEGMLSEGMWWETPEAKATLRRWMDSGDQDLFSDGGEEMNEHEE